MGEKVAIDGADPPPYANGQRVAFNHGPEHKKFSDPHAPWGHRSSISTPKGTGLHGYKVHAVVDVATELLVAWIVETAWQNASALTRFSGSVPTQRAPPGTPQLSEAP